MNARLDRGTSSACPSWCELSDAEHFAGDPDCHQRALTEQGSYLEVDLVSVGDGEPFLTLWVGGNGHEGQHAPDPLLLARMAESLVDAARALAHLSESSDAVLLRTG